MKKQKEKKLTIEISLRRDWKKRVYNYFIILISIFILVGIMIKLAIPLVMNIFSILSSLFLVYQFLTDINFIFIGGIFFFVLYCKVFFILTNIIGLLIDFIQKRIKNYLGEQK